MSKNRIAVRTNKGEYIGGEKIYGAIYLWICSTEPCRGVKLKFKGYEKCEWEYREVKEEDGRLKEKTGTRKFRNERFRAESRLIDYEDGIPMGHYAYPFYYTLPHGLPGSFKSQGVQANNDKWQAEILYSVTAEVEMSGAAEVLQASQFITVSESLPMGPVDQEIVTDSRKVKICCCIPRGDVLLTAWLDKKAFISGESAQLHLDVKNNSSVDIESFIVKLIRVVNLKAKDKGELSGSHDEKPATLPIRMPIISENAITIKHTGCPCKNKRGSEITLELRDKTTQEAFQATTKGQLIQCRYYIDVTMDIPYALPIMKQIPITVQAPINKMWHDWEPPQWVYRCNIINVTSPCAVPDHLLGSKLFANIPGFQADPFS